MEPTLHTLSNLATRAEKIAETLASLILTKTGIAVSRNGAVLTILATADGNPVTVECTTLANDFTASDLLPAWQTATVKGAFAKDDVLTTTINGIAVCYKVVDPDATKIAPVIVQAINSATALDPVTGLPLNSVVFATSDAAVVIVHARDHLALFHNGMFDVNRHSGNLYDRRP